MKINTYPNFANVLLHRYDAGNSLRISARLNKYCIKLPTYLLLNPIMNDPIKPPSGLFMGPETKFNWKSMLYQLSAECGHFMIIPGETFNIHFKQFIIASLCSKDMFLFTYVILGVIPSPISISSKGSADEKPSPNISTSSKSYMVVTSWPLNKDG
jgi:hypothetical protein